MTTNESRYFLLAAILVFLGLVALLLSGFLAPLILGALLAAISHRWYGKLLLSLGDRQDLAALLILLLIVAVIILPTLLLIVFLANEAFNLFLQTQAQIELRDNAAATLLESISKKINADAEAIFRTQVLPALKNFGLYLSERLSGILSDVVELIFGFFVMLVTTFYLLRDGKSLGEFLIKVSPLKTDDEVSIFETFKKVGRAVFYGNFLSALAQGGLGALGFWIFGLDSPLLWGAMMAFLGLIPLLGPYLVFLPATAYLYLIGQAGTAIVFLTYNFLLVSGVDNIIKPKFISEEIKIHPLLILLSILGALKIFGIIGIIYGPLIVAIFFALLNIYLKTTEA
jgi:predicted PurR-regulated permease PerM